MSEVVETALRCPACGQGNLLLCYMEERIQALEIRESVDGGDTEADDSSAHYTKCGDRVTYTEVKTEDGKRFLRYDRRIDAESCGAYFLVGLPPKEVYGLERGDGLLPYLQQGTREEVLARALRLVNAPPAVRPAPAQGHSTVETPTRDGRIRTKVLYVTYNEED